MIDPKVFLCDWCDRHPEFCGCATRLDDEQLADLRGWMRRRHEHALRLAAASRALAEFAGQEWAA